LTEKIAKCIHLYLMDDKGKYAEGPKPRMGSRSIPGLRLYIPFGGTDKSRAFLFDFKGFTENPSSLLKSSDAEEIPQEEKSIGMESSMPSVMAGNATGAGTRFRTRRSVSLSESLSISAQTWTSSS
jgi:hypothetical protein